MLIISCNTTQKTYIRYLTSKNILPKNPIPSKQKKGGKAHELQREGFNSLKTTPDFQGLDHTENEIL